MVNILSKVSTTATMIGSFVKVDKGSKINSITVKLGNQKSGVDKKLGRHIALVYWIKDKNFNKCNMVINPNNTELKMYWFDSVSSKSLSSYDTITYSDEKTYKYFDTNKLTKNSLEDVTFSFSNSQEITESEIFVALIATRGISSSIDVDDVNEGWTTYEQNNNGILYWKQLPIDSNVKLTATVGKSLNIVKMNVTKVNDDQSTSNKPTKIKFSDIKYRTWSSPQNIDLSPSIKINKIDHQLSVIDGGETCGYLYNKLNRSDIIANNTPINIKIKDINNKDIYINALPYIMNDKTTQFINDYNIPEGKLTDVTYARPNEEGLFISGDNIAQPRWCFKRSRIKFTIPAYTNSNYGMIISYLVRTPISNKSIYTTIPKQKFYDKDEVKKDINIVICPRDEGILDNMPFEIVFYRQYAKDINHVIGYKSDDAVYKFHTYQKPIANITYPKIIRNDSTWTEDDIETRNFKYAKIPTSNIYSSFDGEQAVRNKYVCDALNVLFSTPKNDDSGIPMFVRFYVAEFKYGRDGCFGTDENNPIDTSITTQDLFKSRDKNKYTKLTDILDGTTQPTDCTAYLTNIFTNDGAPLLLSGRFTNKTLKEVGENYKLWTFNTWDYVVDDDEKDVKVFNAWEIISNEHDSNGNRILENGKPKSIVISKNIVGDHKDKPTMNEQYNDGDWKSVNYPTSKMLLFRAGYCYLIKIRMFHGAAAGAIGAKYGTNNPVCLGITNTGLYNYNNKSNSTYYGPYPINDGSKYGYNNPYELNINNKNEKWVGPDDGTSNISLNNKNLNETFPGFSEVDYTIFEAVAPYTSKSNLVTVHPTSPNISVNQCLSFNYRHLAKNIGEIDDWVWNPSANQGNGQLQEYMFGQTYGGIQNTISRILSMYTSCAEQILNKYFNVRGTDGFEYYKNKLNISNCSECSHSITQEKLTLRIKNINYINSNNTDESIYVNSKPKKYDIPIINYYDLQEDNKSINSYNDLLNERFYTNNFEASNGITYDCGCYRYNEYRLSLKDEKIRKNNRISNTTSYFKDSQNKYMQWPELNIIYKRPNLILNNSTINEEPLGNVYRWQPVINAMSDGKEIPIQNKNTVIDVNKPNSIMNGGSMTCDSPLYINSVNDGSIQQDYFYEDINTQTKRSNDNQVSLSNNSSNRFTINEFAGEVMGDIKSSGYPVMYTMPSNSSSTTNVKYFDISNNEKTYGKLFTRVPSIQDCENGIVTNGTINFGSLGRFADTNIVNETNIYSLDSNGNNVYPLVRTTHYLYFKTHINVTFTLEIDVQLKYFSGCSDEVDEEGNKKHNQGTEQTTDVKTFFLNSTGTDINNSETNSIITFGNTNGIAEVYAEDNNGWGRCLSADDISNLPILSNGKVTKKPIIKEGNVIGFVDSNNESGSSGGIEVPLLIRYTPLLQPKVISETINNKTKTNVTSKNVTIKEDKYGNVSKVLFNDGNDVIETNSINLNINYPFIPENETYYTRNPDGGATNIKFGNYYIDNDTDTPYNRNDKPIATNMDFLGGYGICTAYTVLLVPSDPNLTNLTSKTYPGYNNYYLTNDEINKYFKNTDGHWNYFKQPNNYYKSGHIYGIRSKTQTDAGPVLVAYNAQLNEDNKGEFLKNNIINNGRNNQSISLNINNLRKCKVYYKNEWVDCETFNEQKDIKNANIKLNKKYNKLNTGLIYDLVIIPIYSNSKDTTYNYIADETNAGTLNGKTYGASISDTEKEIHFAGSNPLVLFNYLQVSANIISIDDGGGGDIPTPPPGDDKPEDLSKIHNTSHAIVFPNVDHDKYNFTRNNVKESPGFWLNNSFRLILRLPSYRTNATKISDMDNYTIENMSGGELDSNNTANDFRFKDIQIHIGKYSEILDYVGNKSMETTLNKITDKDELARLHIISYKDYYNSNVFSKRLDDIIPNDSRELATGGALDPTNENYKNRFIEVNLSNVTIKGKDNISNVPIYTNYPEGFYIQFRVKSNYSSADEKYQWTEWCGGSWDGGLTWWGNNGTEYFVPIRNYSEIFTDFRNYIKDSFPGSNLSFGKGSLLSYANYNNTSKSKPTSASLNSYHKKGLGNDSNSKLVGTNNLKFNNTKCTNYKLTKGNNNKWYYKEENIIINEDSDWPYKNKESYKNTHDTSISLTNDTSRLWEMLYIDFIIRNMCKLYYKPKYNNLENSWNDKLYYHLSVPYDEHKNPIILNKVSCSWDQSEYNLFKTSDSKTNLNNQDVVNEDKTKKDTEINGKRLLSNFYLDKWDVNKYYRKPINMQDFNELNNHLCNLLEYIRHEYLSGKTDENENTEAINSVLPIKSNNIQLDLTRKGIIGNSIDIENVFGQGIINNLTNQLLSSNYIQEIWNNIKIICQCENDTKIID